MTCRVEGCDREVHIKKHKLCFKHYFRLWKNGDVHAVLTPKPLSDGPVVKTIKLRGKDFGLTQAEIDNFYGKIKKTNSCWHWESSIGWDGYGRFSLRKNCYLAHRFSYELNVGPIPTGMQIDHLCRNRFCVNPAHLDPVDNDENMYRRVLARAHCKNGHPFDEKNTYVNPNRGRFRVCRKCAALYQRRRNARLASVVSK